jgi:holo-[acyl-carrier protein] synthase
VIEIRTGIDMVEVSRVANSLERFGDSFINRVFLPAESAYCLKMANPSMHFAARFAAKEAVAKALGTGIGEGLSWLDIEIERTTEGRPRLRLHGRGAELAGKMGIVQMDVSMTHTSENGAAHVVLLLERPVRSPGDHS